MRTALLTYRTSSAVTSSPSSHLTLDGSRASWSKSENGPGVGVGVRVGSGVGVVVAVGSGVGVGAVVEVGAGVGVAAGSGLGVAVGVGLAVGSGVRVGVADDIGVGESVDSGMVVGISVETGASFGSIIGTLGATRTSGTVPGVATCPTSPPCRHAKAHGHNCAGHRPDETILLPHIRIRGAVVNQINRSKRLPSHPAIRHPGPARYGPGRGSRRPPPAGPRCRRRR